MRSQPVTEADEEPCVNARSMALVRPEGIGERERKAREELERAGRGRFREELERFREELERFREGEREREREKGRESKQMHLFVDRCAH